MITRIPFIASLTVLIGLPLLFLVVSLVAGNWSFLLYALPPSFIAGFTGLIVTLKFKKQHIVMENPHRDE